MELWHNPRCSKSRSAKAILAEDRGVAYTERRYVDDPPTADELAVRSRRSTANPGTWRL